MSLLEAERHHEAVRGHHRARLRDARRSRRARSVGLIGPNGAGKTTFFNCLLGILRPDGGPGRLRRPGHHPAAGVPAGPARLRPDVPAHRAVRRHDRPRPPPRGRAGPPRHRRLWKDVLNLGRGRPPTSTSAPTARSTLLGLDDVADRPIESLSLGRGRLVEVGRALMTEPMLLLLDEPSSGLDHRETRSWPTRCRRCSASAAPRSCSSSTTSRWCSASPTRLYVLDFGTLIASGPTDEVLADDAVRKAYLGSWYDRDDRAPAHGRCSSSAT